MYSIQAFACGPLHNNTYVIASEHSAVIVDPSRESVQRVHAYIQEHALHCEALWLTHAHLDHMSGCAKLVSYYDIPVYIHSKEIQYAEHPGSDGLGLWMPCEGIEAFAYDNEMLCGSSHWNVISTAGHSCGSVCLYTPGALLSGDTLFRGTYGAIHFPLSHPQAMGQSLLTLFQLPDDTIIYPGHGAYSTIAQEKAWMIIQGRILANETGNTLV